MIQIFADGVLAYDSRLEDYDLQGLRLTSRLNKGGTAEIVMPPYHPAYSLFTGYRTVVEIYRDGELRFRGRALYPVDDFNNTRTLVCEGELCFLQDALSRPYLYKDSPAEIFKAVVAEYNAQVEPFKRFVVGQVTVTDPNDYVRLESESAETVLATIDKLVERCGGYIVFTTNEVGARVINWFDAISKRSSQTIEAGENLLNFSRSVANTDLATVIVPYGAKDETTGERLTIRSVNGGKDYLADDTAVRLRGTIIKTVTWDDVTLPMNLLKKARQLLNESRQVITSLTLTALDLSYVDKTVDSFKIGDTIRVISKAHDVNQDFQLVEHSEDLLNPAQSSITLGKEIRTLTGLDVAGDHQSQSDLQKKSVEIKQDFELNVQKSVEAMLEGNVEQIVSKIEQKAGSIELEVSGSLGGTATITLTSGGGTAKTAELDLSQVRRAFANDRSEVVINGGTVAFNSNTIIINSTNFRVSADGTIKATNAELSGTAITENGLYKSELSAGRLRFAYDGVEMGGIASGYMGGDADVRGVAVRLEADAKYIGFSKLDAEGDGYDLTYCINYGANPGGRTERHVFHGSAYFGHNLLVDGQMNVNSSLAVKGHVGLNGAYSVKFLNNAGAYINGLGKYADDDSLFVGQDGYDIYIYGANVCLGNASDGLVQIRGAESSVTSPFTFGNTATFNGQATFNGISFYNNFAYFVSNAYFLANTIISNNTGMKGQNASGTDTIWVAAVNSSNEVILGDQEFTTYIQGASILLGTGSSTVTVRSNLGLTGALQLNNGYGVQIKNTGGSDCYVLSFNSSNQVNVGHLSYPMYLRGTHVTVNTGNFTVYQGSVVLSNGYGIQGKDSSGNPYYILSVTTGNQVGVGATGLPLYLRGSGVYLASSGATVTSDRRKKNSIEELGDAYEALLDKITPVRFKFNDGTSGRYHAGFIAQDVREALEASGLSTQDFGGFVDINKDGAELGIIYSEFIALLLHKVKKLERRIAELEEVTA